MKKYFTFKEWSRLRKNQMLLELGNEVPVARLVNKLSAFQFLPISAVSDREVYGLVYLGGDSIPKMQQFTLNQLSEWGAERDTTFKAERSLAEYFNDFQAQRLEYVRAQEIPEEPARP